MAKTLLLLRGFGSDLLDEQLLAPDGKIITDDGRVVVDAMFVSEGSWLGDVDTLVLAKTMGAFLLPLF